MNASAGERPPRKTRYVRFKDFKKGLHNPPTPVYLETRQKYMGSEWEGFVRHEIIYVNTSDKEIVYQAFGVVGTMTEENFDHRGYLTQVL